MEEKLEKSSDAKKVFDNWKGKKDEYLKEQARKKREEKKRKEEEELDKEERQQASKRVFEVWKDEKKKRPTSARSPSPALTQRAWCPNSRNSASNDIPKSVKPVIVRNAPPGRHQRTMSASGRLQDTKRSK